MSLQQGEPQDLRDWPSPPKASVHLHTEGLPEPLPNEDIPPHTHVPNVLNRQGPLSMAQFGQLLTAWHTQRSWFPGWVSLPEANRSQVWMDLQGWLQPPSCDQLLSVIAGLSAGEQVLSLHELAWRLDVALCPLLPPFVPAIVAALERINPYPDRLDLDNNPVTPSTTLTPSEGWPHDGPTLDWNRVSQAWVALAFMLLRSAREDFDLDGFTKWAHRLEGLSHLRPEWREQLLYERCANHLVRLELQKLKSSLAAWKPAPALPYWRAKRAALLAEIGDEALATEEVATALGELQSGAASGKPTIGSMSEEGWILYLSDLLEDSIGLWAAARPVGHDRSPERRRRLDQLALFRCDPNEHLLDRHRKLQGSHLREFTTSQYVDEFDPGYISRSKSFSNRDPDSWFFIRTFEVGPLPVRTSGMTIFKDALAISARDLFLRGDHRLPLSILLRLGEKKNLDSILSRSVVAVLPLADVSTMYTWISGALREAMAVTDGNHPDQSYSLSRRLLSPCCRVLSRLLFRLEGDQRQDACRLAKELYCAKCFRMDIWSLGSDVRSYFRRLFFSLSPTEVVACLPDLLSLPIPGVDGFDAAKAERWPEPFEELHLPSSFRLDSCGGRGNCTESVARLLNHAASSGEARARAVYRLLWVHQMGGLTASETQEFGAALWGQVDHRGLPSGTNVLDHWFHRLPYPSSVKPLERVKAAILAEAIPSVFETFEGRTVISSAAAHRADTHLRSILWGSASPVIPRGSEWLDWTASEAAELLLKLDQWSSTLTRLEGFMQEALTAATSLLCRVLVPVLWPDLESRARCAAVLHRLGREGAIPIESLPVALLLGTSNPEEVAAKILREFHNVDLKAEDNLHGSGEGVFLWLGYANFGLLAPPPRWLLSEIATVLVVLQHPGLVQGFELMAACLKSFPGQIDQGMLDQLLRALSYAAQSSALSATLLTSPEAHDLSRRKPAYRAAASKLASELVRHHQRSGRDLPPVLVEWRDIGNADVLPEVRSPWFLP